MQRTFIMAFVLLALPALAQRSSQYAGQHNREISALSAQETADLLEGRGMGLARSAELNSYPGPMHVLELRDQLGLSVGQREAVQVSFGRMRSAARPLGAQIVERERALDSAFKAGIITPDRMMAETDAIGTLQGRLRAVHLGAHLEMRAVLTPDQVAQYDRARGYTAGGAAPSPGGAHHQ